MTIERKKTAAEQAIPPKMPDVLRSVREHIKSGNYRESWHCEENRKKKADRRFTRQEIRYVLLSGERDETNDRFCEKRRNWSYAICGWTLDHDLKLRVIVCFDESGLMVITVYCIQKTRLV